MANVQRQTSTYRDFDDDLNQAILLADVVSTEGERRARLLQSEVESAILRVMKVDRETFDRMSLAERTAASMGVPLAEQVAMTQRVQQAQHFQDLGIKTAPPLSLYILWQSGNPITSTWH